MALYLEKAIFVNRAPFENIELNFKEYYLTLRTHSTNLQNYTFLESSQIRRVSTIVYPHHFTI